MFASQVPTPTVCRQSWVPHSAKPVSDQLAALLACLSLERHLLPLPPAAAFSNPNPILPQTIWNQLVYDCLGTLMGIPNLLRFMKPFIEPVHIKKYAGQRVSRSPMPHPAPAVPSSADFSLEPVLRSGQVGIDAYSWLHKGAYSCSMELCMNPKSAGARRYISYFMHHVDLLRHHKVVPVVVFDGGSMPCKSATDKDRHKYANSKFCTAWLRNAVPFCPFFMYSFVSLSASNLVRGLGTVRFIRVWAVSVFATLALF